ncbi:MAG: hypothetical protein IPJ82_22465 [Lewinellaceae bacterium]|nr:hypothetical protein [Lewinellaceae bacterium]
MENTIGQFAQIAAMGVAIFYALLAGSGLFNLYLRFNDRLSIDREDVQTLSRNSGFALGLTGIAGLFHYLPFYMASGFLFCGIVFYQILKINGLLKIMDRP